MSLLVLAGGARAEDLGDCYRADVAGKSGDLGLAIDYYTRCIDTGELAANNLTIAYNRLGSVRIQAGEFDRAIADFNAAIRLDPNHANSYSNRGNSYRLKGDYSRAMRNYRQAVRLDPRHTEAYHNFGLLYHALADYKRAITSYSRAIEIEPALAKLYNSRGMAYSDQGDRDRAL